MDINNEKLIEAVREHECNYLKTSPWYKNKQMRDAAWEAVAAILQANSYKCKTRWRTLCDRPRWEIAVQTSASGSSAQHYKPWKLMSMMSFVNDSQGAESTVGNVHDVTEFDPLPDTCKWISTKEEDGHVV